MEPHPRLRTPEGGTVNETTQDISILMQVIRTLLELSEEAEDHGLEAHEAIHTASVLAEDIASTWEPDMFDDEEQRILTSLLNNVH